MMEDTSSDSLARLRRYLSSRMLDGLIVPRTDAHQSEITTAYDDRLRHISGFTGSAGVGLVLRNSALIFVDGRYQIQVRREVDPTTFEVLHEVDNPLDRWLRTNAEEGWRIAVDSMLLNCTIHDRIRDGLAAAGAELVKLEQDPFDDIWIGRPGRASGSIRPVALALSGETSRSKRERIATLTSEAGADLLIETLPDNIAWLLNVRGSDVPMNPVPHSFLVLCVDGDGEWFVDRRKLGVELADYELDGIALADPESFLFRVAQLAEGRRCLVDPAFTPEAVRAKVLEVGGRVVACPNPITAAKATKTTAELEGFRNCHVEDGVAVTNFLAWLADEMDGRRSSLDPVTELEAEARLLSFRTERQGFLEPSFRSISATGPNAAMCHYRSQPNTNAPLGGNLPYLIDSGGQYLQGTTDVTRCVMLGLPSAEVKSAYTAILKGLLSLLMVRFPIGTQGHQLDAFARRALWDIGLDFDHTTGHGVGHNLLIHEQPIELSKGANSYRLRQGNIVTIEPGYYRDGAFGLRIENQVEVVSASHGFCRFSSLTLVPIEMDMVDIASLTVPEITCLNDYHSTVRRKLERFIRPEAMAYLIRHTQAVPIEPNAHATSSV